MFQPIPKRSPGSSIFIDKNFWGPMASLNSTQTITKNHRNTSPSVKPILYRIGVIDQKRNVAGFLSLLPSFLTMFDLGNFCSHIEKKSSYLSALILKLFVPLKRMKLMKSKTVILPASPPLFNNKSKISLELQHDKYLSSSWCFSLDRYRWIIMSAAPQ